MPLVGRRRPLLRAAAIGGGAYVAGKRRQEAQERQAGQEQRLESLESQQQAAPASGAGGLSADAMAKLEQLGKLHDEGVLSDEEFAQQKAKLLDG